MPEVQNYLWAEIKLPSTLLGSLASTLYKRPGLRIHYRYADSHTESFRYIEGMGEAGFIISPVIHDNAEFTALYQQPEERRTKAQPVSFWLTTNAHGRHFWQKKFHLRFSTPNE